MSGCLCFILIFLHCWQFIAGKYDFNEIRSAVYDVSILSTPLLLPTEERLVPDLAKSQLADAVSGRLKVATDSRPTSGRDVLISNVYGQQYYCLFPAYEESASNILDNTSIPKTSNVTERLSDALMHQPCLRKTVKWWTYEFCYGMDVKQYHVDNNNQIEGQIMYLGYFRSDFDWDKASKDDLQLQWSGSVRFHEQQYANGSFCAVTKQQRNAIVRFFCEEDVESYLYSVDELASCHYLLTVHSMDVCGLPGFLPKDYKPPPLDIKCQPALNKEDHQLYQLQKDAEEQRLISAASMKQRQEEHQRMMAEVDKLEDEQARIKDSVQDIIYNLGLDSADFDEDLNKMLNEVETMNDMEVDDADLNTVETSAYENAQHIGPTLAKLKGQLPTDMYANLATALNEFLSELELDKNKRDKQAKSPGTSPNPTFMETVMRVPRDKMRIASTQKTEDEEVASDNHHGSNVRVRVSEVKSEGLSEKAQGKFSAETRRLEEAVANKLKKAGFESNGRHIQVKIITSVDFDQNSDDFKILSDRESNQFTDLLLSVLGGDTHQRNEERRYRDLAQNYRWQFDKKSSTPSAEQKEND